MSYNIGVNLLEVDGPASPGIMPAPTSVAGFLVRTPRGPTSQAVRVTNYGQFIARFGPAPGLRSADSISGPAFGLAAVKGFFDNGGSIAYISRVVGDQIHQLETVVEADTLTARAGRHTLAEPGAWGQNIGFEITPDVVVVRAQILTPAGGAEVRKLEELPHDNTLGSLGRLRSNFVVFDIADDADPARSLREWEGEYNFTAVEVLPTVPFADVWISNHQVRLEALRAGEEEPTLTARIGGDGRRLDIVLTPIAEFDQGGNEEELGQVAIERYLWEEETTFDEWLAAVNESRYVKARLRKVGEAPEDLAPDTELSQADAEQAAAEEVTPDPEPGAGAFASALDTLDRDQTGIEIQLLVCPDCAEQPFVLAALEHCARDGERMLIAHHPVEKSGQADVEAFIDDGNLRASKRYGALYSPWLGVIDPEGGAGPVLVPPVGHIAGIYARIDRERGLWKAPAGRDSVLRGAVSVQRPINDTENTLLARAGVNAIRSLRGQGIIVDASRTLSSDSRWRYVGTRRLFNFVKASLREGLRWAVHEPNDPTLWKQLQYGSVEPFLLGLWRRGAFGNWPAEDVFTVRIDETNNTPAQVAEGELHVEVSFYPVRPAETIVIRVGQQDVGGTVTES